MISMGEPRVGRANRNRTLGGRSWIYFVQAGESGPVKIGRTRQLWRRLIALDAFHHEPIRLLGTIPETDVPETRLHDAFRADWIKGEWFRPSQAILALAAAGKAIYGDGYVEEIPAHLDAEWLLIKSYVR